MNKTRMNAARASAPLYAAYWLAALALVLLLGISRTTNAQDQTATPPPPRPHGQMGMQPLARARVPVPVSTKVETPKTTAAGEQFFIVASLDQSKSEILFKRPDEVTLLANATPKTQYFDENGKSLKLGDLRAGDTVWVTSTGGAQPTVIRVRKGQMTIAELHTYYLDYPEIK
jgi:hypothetical protein